LKKNNLFEKKTFEKKLSQRSLASVFHYTAPTSGWVGTKAFLLPPGPDYPPRYAIRLIRW